MPLTECPSLSANFRPVFRRAISGHANTFPWQTPDWDVWPYSTEINRFSGFPFSGMPVRFCCSDNGIAWLCRELRFFWRVSGHAASHDEKLA